jgi:GNAT superfamily N-acetyltransferase
MIKTPSAPAGPLRDFQVQWVFGNISEPLRQQIVAFWLQEGAMTNPDEAWRRSWEVACILREVVGGNIAGVCTVAIRLDDHGVSYGFIRLFIRRASRLAGLNVRLMETMIQGFEEMAREPGAPRHLVATIENRKMERRAAQRILARLHFVQAGTTANGELIMQRSLTTPRDQLNK